MKNNWPLTIFKMHNKPQCLNALGHKLLKLLIALLRKLGIMHIIHSNMRLSSNCKKETLCWKDKDDNLILCSFSVSILTSKPNWSAFYHALKTRSSYSLKCPVPSSHVALVAVLSLNIVTCTVFISPNLQTLTGSYSHEKLIFFNIRSPTLLIFLSPQQGCW